MLVTVLECCVSNSGEALQSWAIPQRNFPCVNQRLGVSGGLEDHGLTLEETEGSEVVQRSSHFLSPVVLESSKGQP